MNPFSPPPEIQRLGDVSGLNPRWLKEKLVTYDLEVLMGSSMPAEFGNPAVSFMAGFHGDAGELDPAYQDGQVLRAQLAALEIRSLGVDHGTFVFEVRNPLFRGQPWLIRQALGEPPRVSAAPQLTYSLWQGTVDQNPIDALVCVLGFFSDEISVLDR